MLRTDLPFVEGARASDGALLVELGDPRGDNPELTPAQAKLIVKQMMSRMKIMLASTLPSIAQLQAKPGASRVSRRSTSTAAVSRRASASTVGLSHRWIIKSVLVFGLVVPLLWILTAGWSASRSPRQTS